MLTEKEIQEAAEQYKISRDRATFEQGVQWALQQMKNKPLELWTIVSWGGIEEICKSEEKAETALKSFKKDHPSASFYIDKYIIEP